MFGQSHSTPENVISHEEDWRIVAVNNDNGFMYFYNPSKIWKKDSFYTCNIKLLIDSVKLSKLQGDLKKKNYNHSIYRLRIDCTLKKLQVIDSIHYNDQGKAIPLPMKKRSLFILSSDLKETIVSNVCKETKYPWFNANEKSPF